MREAVATVAPSDHNAAAQAVSRILGSDTAVERVDALSSEVAADLRAMKIGADHPDLGVIVASLVALLSTQALMRGGQDSDELRERLHDEVERAAQWLVRQRARTQIGLYYQGYIADCALRLLDEQGREPLRSVSASQLAVAVTRSLADVIGFDSVRADVARVCAAGTGAGGRLH